ncbi:MAG: hypothetical protein B0D88_02805, partial [Candidatus Sedimenticola endophacoides]
MGINDELYTLGTQWGPNSAARNAAYNAYLQNTATAQMGDAVWYFINRWAERRRFRANVDRYINALTSDYARSLERIHRQLKADLEDKAWAMGQKERDANLYRCSMEMEQTALRDLLLEEIAAGVFPRDAANAHYQRALGATLTEAVERMRADPERARYLDTENGAKRFTLTNRAIDSNAFADEEEFIYTYGELPTWLAGLPAPADYRHPTPLEIFDHAAAPDPGP